MSPTPAVPAVTRDDLNDVHFRKRIGWTVADQAVSSLSNFGVGLAVAKTSSASEFGAFGVAYLYYLLVIQVSRALASDPLVIRYSGTEPGKWRDGTGRSAATAMSVGAVAGFGAIAIGAAVRGPLGAALIATGVMLPGLTLQDLWRYSFFARHEPRSAFVNDCVWLVAQLGAFVAVRELASVSLVTALLAWGGAGVGAAVFGGFQANLVPRVAGVKSWLREHKDIGPRYVAEVLVVQGARQITLYVVGVVAGLAALGGIRGAQLLLNPVNVIFLGAEAAVVPEAARRRDARRDVREVTRLSRHVSVVLGLSAAAWGAVLVGLPSSVGRALLGATWPYAHAMILPLAIGTVAEGVVVGPWTGLRAMAAAIRSLRARTIVAATTLCLGTAGALASGARGCAIGLAATSCISAATWWRELAAAVSQVGRRHRGWRQ